MPTKRLMCYQYARSGRCRLGEVAADRVRTAEEISIALEMVGAGRKSRAIPAI
ncbi:MAG: hypothetical protein ACYC7I_01995 [Gammaproteobacteria bacterium]